MSTLVSIDSSPLMQPVHYNGQTYYTGQYFHQLYRANSDAGGKYKQAAHFLRLIRSIEAYPFYVESGDIVELTKADAELALADGEADPNLGSAFKATFGKPIMLINATAQVALTHHLDDEVSKQASVTINRNAASPGKSTELQLAKAASAWLEATLKAAKLLGTDEPMARTIAVDIVNKRVGVDFSRLLAGNTVEEAPITSTELGREWGLTGKIGEKMNAALRDQGYAEKNENGDWVPTEKGKPYATVNPFKSPHSEHTGYRTLWYRRILDVLKKEEVA
jgi:hypothetical protein